MSMDPVVLRFDRQFDKLYELNSGRCVTRDEILEWRRWGVSFVVEDGDSCYDITDRFLGSVGNARTDVSQRRHH